MKEKTKTVRHPGDPRKVLRLPSTYRIRLSVDGWIGPEHWAVRVLGSDTGGTEVVFAMSKSWAPWFEVFRAEAENIAKHLIEDNLKGPAR